MVVRCYHSVCGWYHYGCINLDEAPDARIGGVVMNVRHHSHTFTTTATGVEGKEEMIQCVLQSGCLKDECSYQGAQMICHVH